MVAFIYLSLFENKKKFELHYRKFGVICHLIIGKKET